MKKTLTILVSIILLLTLTITTKAQNGEWALSAQGGYSWINGVVGGEIQYENFAFGIGWMPTTMPLTGDRVSSVGYQFTFYGGKYYEPGYYISIGQASAGYRAESSSSWGDSYSDTAPMTIVMGGYKGASKTFYYKIGLGYGWCDQAKSWTGEIMIGIPLLTNY